MNVKEKDLEKERIETNVEKSNEDKSFEEEFTPTNNTKKFSISIFKILLIIIFIILLISILILFTYTLFNNNIISGVSIKGHDVSHLSKSDAKYQLEKYISENLPEEIKLKHGDFETTISIEQIEANFDIKRATNSAYEVGRQGNFLQNSFYILSTMFGKVNIEPRLTLNKEQLSKNLEDISTQLPDKVIQSSYYIENSELIITSGKEGNIVDIDTTTKLIKDTISDFSKKDKTIEIAVKTEQPDEVNIEKIHILWYDK